MCTINGMIFRAPLCMRRFFISMKVKRKHGPDCQTHSIVGNDEMIKGPDPVSTSMHVS